MKNKTDIQTKNQQIDKILQEQYDVETKILESALLNVAGKTSWDEFPEESEEKIRAGYDRLITRLRETGDFNEAARAEKTGSTRAAKEKLESLIAEFRLQKVRKNKGNQLSGGERRRTEIARCLAIDPKFIMLDEPFAGVDPIAVEDIQQIVWKLKDKNIGILITDHNVQETLSITDRAYLLFEGKILFQGTPEELSENQIVREKYLSNSFVLRRKDFQLEK